MKHVVQRPEPIADVEAFDAGEADARRASARYLAVILNLDTPGSTINLNSMLSTGTVVC